jgi:hypothetical protein
VTDLPDFTGAEFEDIEPAPKPNHEASKDYSETEPPPPSRGTGGSRWRKRPAPAPKAKRADAPTAVKTLIPNRKGQFVEPLMKMYGGVGAMLMMYDPICGTAVMTSAQKCAETLDDLAYQNEAVRQVVWSLTRTSAFGAVIVAHLPIIMAITMHHVPAAQQAFGQLGANMMEEFLKQTTPGEPPVE